MSGRDSRNRAQVLTAPGAAAIAVIRIAGPRVPAFFQSHFNRPLVASRCVHGELCDDADHVIDDPVIVLLPGGMSADINLHGGPRVVQATIDLLLRAGFEVTTTELLDHADELENEIVTALPLAGTEMAIRTLLAQRDAWRKPRAADGRSPAEIVNDRALWWLLHPPTVALVGGPNVGKSTLANQLFGHARSITADLPGTTRDWIDDWVDLDGLIVRLLDTPGVRETSDPLEAAAISQARNAILTADLLVHVIDAGEADVARIDLPDRPTIRVLNKIDRAIIRSGDERHIRTSGINADGIDQLRTTIRRHFGCDDLDVSRKRWWTDRQRAMLSE